MSPAESVFDAVTAWIGIVTGISGVVLAIVAIIFAVYVQRDANAVSRQTIESIKRIEAEVDKLSSDTTQLIKAAWDRMVAASLNGNSQGYNLSSRDSFLDGDPDDTPPTPSARRSHGEAGRVGSTRVNSSNESGSSSGTSDEGNSDPMPDLLRALQESVDAARNANSLDTVPALRRRIEKAGPLAAEIMRIVANGRHITEDQVQGLDQFTGVGEAVRRLTHLGLLAPASSQSPEDEGETVWWVSPNIPLDDLNSALLMSRSTKTAHRRVVNALTGVNYPAENDGTAAG